MGKNQEKNRTMIIVVYTNKAFSAILNSNSKISKIILQPRSTLHFYSTNQLQTELATHWGKLRKLSCYYEIDVHRAAN